jgi:HK97 family phage portal protein
MSAALSVDIHNSGMKWNYSLLSNSARPSGIIKFEGSPGGEVIARLTEFFKSRIQGAANAGEIPMLHDGAEWQAIDHSPRDMDFQGSMKEAKQLIASNLGVPLPLVDNDASSYNNMEQAKERFYVDTVIPLMEDFIEAFSHWLLPNFDGDLSFSLDLDSVPALEAVRTRKFDRAIKAVGAQVLTREEGREMMGFDPQADGEFVERVKPQPTETRSLAALAYG